MALISVLLWSAYVAHALQTAPQALSRRLALARAESVGGPVAVDVSDLGVTVDDLETPLPTFERDEVPVFDANAYKRAYYRGFSEAKWRRRGDLATATTREAAAPAKAPAARPPPEDSWRVLFRPTPALGYAQRLRARESFFIAAEREHGRAATLGLAAVAAASLDARLAALVLAARCGCADSLARIGDVAPNVAVEAPLLLVAAGFAAREVRRARRAPPRRGDPPATTKRALQVELVQGRAAMLGTLLCFFALPTALAY